MSTTLPPQPWPAPNALMPAGGARWRFGVAEQGDSGSVLRWRMRRNCSITPAQMMSVYLSLCGVSLAVAAMFFVNGAPYVLGFTSVELLAVGAALLVYARHATDREWLTLSGRRLEVEQVDGGQASRAAFRAEWLTVEPSGGQGSLIELAGQGQMVRVGRFLRPEQRSAFAQELRQAVRLARLVTPAPNNDSTTR